MLVEVLGSDAGIWSVEFMTFEVQEFRGKLEGFLRKQKDIEGSRINRATTQ